MTFSQQCGRDKSFCPSIIRLALLERLRTKPRCPRIFSCSKKGGRWSLIFGIRARDDAGLAKIGGKGKCFRIVSPHSRGSLFVHSYVSGPKDMQDDVRGKAGQHRRLQPEAPIQIIERQCGECIQRDYCCDNVCQRWANYYRKVGQEGDNTDDRAGEKKEETIATGNRSKRRSRSNSCTPV